MPDWTDTHCHLQDDRLWADRTGVLARARAAGVATLICCGADESDWARVAELAAADAGVIPAFGLHPFQVHARSPHWLASLRNLLHAHPRAVVGEIGLDGADARAGLSAQAECLTAQLDLARELDRAVSIHCRRAWAPLLTCLRGRRLRGAIHAYSGGTDQLPRLAATGLGFAFAGSLTYPGNRRGIEAARACPADRLLLESDAPDMLPAPLWPARDALRPPNEPAALVHTAATLADVRGLDLDALAALTTANAARLFAPGAGA